MIYEFSTCAKHCVNIPQLDWQFVYNILHIAGSGFSCRLVFYVEVVSIVLYADDPVTSSPLQVPFARLLVFKEYSVTNFKIRWGALCCFLCMHTSVFIQSLFSYGKCKAV